MIRNDVAKELERIDKQVLEYGLLLLLSLVIFVVSCTTLWWLIEKYQIVLIHSTRDTLKRSVSHYLHQKSKGRCVNLADCIEKFLNYHRKRLWYVQASLVGFRL